MKEQENQNAKAEQKDGPLQVPPVPDVPKQEPAKVCDDVLVLWVLEYCETQSNGVFHLNPGYQRKDGSRYTEHWLFGTDYKQLVVIPEGRQDLFDRALDFTERFSGEGMSFEDVKSAILGIFPEKYIFTHRLGINVNLDELSLQGAKENPVLVPKQKEPVKIAPRFSIAEFSDQQLWDELKRRGYTIEDNRLVIIKKSYLE